MSKPTITDADLPTLKFIRCVIEDDVVADEFQLKPRADALALLDRISRRLRDDRREKRKAERSKK